MTVSIKLLLHPILWVRINKDPAIFLKLSGSGQFVGEKDLWIEFGYQFPLTGYGVLSVCSEIPTGDQCFN